MRIILITFLLSLSATLWAQNTSKAKEADFYLEYSSSSKTIIIKGNSVMVEEWTEQYDNPISSMPGSRKEVIKTSLISSADLSGLRSLIRSNGFLTLPKNEYGADPGERHYPYAVTVKINSKHKKVLYRSNPAPDTEQIPQAFSEVENKVNEILSGIKEWE